MSQDFAQAQAAHQRGDIAAAERGYRAVLALDAGQGDAAHLLGLICFTTDRMDEGLQWVRTALQLQPKRLDWLINGTEAARRAGHLDEAQRYGTDAVSVGPQSADAHFHLALVYRDRGQLIEAAAEFATVIDLHPRHVRAHLQRGQLMRLEGKIPVAKQHYQTAVKCDPHSVDCWIGLAAAHLDLGEAAESIECLEQARRLDPQREELDRLLGDALSRQGRQQDAATAYARHGQRHGESWWQSLRRELMCAIIPASESAIDEERARILQVVERYQGESRSIPAGEWHRTQIEPPMTLTYHGRDERSMKSAFAALYEPMIAPLEPLSRTRTGRPIVGVVVTTGHEGVFDRCLGPLVARLAARGNLDVRLISTRAGLNVLRHLRPDFPGGMLEIPVEIDAAARTIQTAGVDVLHYWEIGTDSTNYFLPFFQPAPIQTGTWGWPSTAGTTRVTGFVSGEALEISKSNADYVENLFSLHSLPTLYAPPPAPSTPVRSGLQIVPAEAHLYVCVQNLRKLQPGFDGLIGDLLRHDPRGWLLCLADEQPFITELFRRRLQRSIPDVLPRIRCVQRLPREQYLELVTAADVLLDSRPYGGGANTAADALATGTPVVTWPGNAHRGRWQAVVNQLVGLDELNVATSEGFVTQAVKIAADRDYRQHLSTQIATHRERFFHNQATVVEHESLFLSLAEQSRVMT